MPDAPLRSLIYVSRADPNLTSDDLDRIHHSAVNLNALDGITGLLAYDGKYFIQYVEGVHDAVADLLDRLGRDPRHSNIDIRSDEPIDERSFPDWSMNLVRITAGRFEARDGLDGHLPATASAAVRARLTGILDARA